MDAKFHATLKAIDGENLKLARTALEEKAADRTWAPEIRREARRRLAAVDAEINRRVKGDGPVALKALFLP